MDIKEIIKNKTNELIESGKVEKMIEENIQSSIKKSIDSLFGGYQFQRDIEKKISEEIDPALKSIDLSAYKSMVHARAEQMIKSTLDADLAEKAVEQYKALFMLQDEEIKISEIFKLVRGDFISNSDDCYEEYFTLIFDEEESGSFNYLNIFFDKDPDKTNKECEYSFRLMKYGDDAEYTISRMDLDYHGEIKDKLMLFQPGYLSDFERVLLNAYYKKLPIIVDVYEDNIDTSLWS